MIIFLNPWFVLQSILLIAILPIVALVDTIIEFIGSSLAEELLRPSSVIFLVVETIFEINSFDGKSTKVAQFTLPFQYSSTK